MTEGKGIKLFGARDVSAMFKEYKQLQDMKVLGQINPNSISSEQKIKALRETNFFKEKRCGKIKGRTVADENAQRNYVPKEEVASPTLYLESLMAIILINAYEDRKCAVLDIPGAYLHVEIPDDKFVLLKIEREFVEIMTEINPEYASDVRHENEKKVLYVQILKALYGMIESALLWYTLYVNYFQKEGFEVNP